MEVVKAPDQRLRVKTKPIKKITSDLLKTVKEMVRVTKTFTDPEGVGLASTQIGESQQYFVMKQGDGSFSAVFNPRILSRGKRTKVFFEGCLSIPDFYGQVTRSTIISVSYMDIEGQYVKKTLRGVAAWIFQHEYDHLQGKLFMDHVIEQKSRLFKVIGKDRAGAEVFEEVAI